MSAPTRAVRFHAEEMDLTAASLRDAGGTEIATTHDCVNLRRREGERVARYLASLDGNGGA